MNSHRRGFTPSPERSRREPVDEWRVNRRNVGQCHGRKRQRCTGFTLIELLVAVAIIGLISTLVAVGINNARQKTRDGLRKGAMNQVKNALELYYQQFDGFPVSPNAGADFVCLGPNVPAGLGAYINPIPIDPLNNGTNGQRDTIGEGCVAYRSDGTQYKVITAFELDTDTMANDGGVRSCWYERYTSGGQSYDPPSCP